ncbi:MAG: hypothetical protein JRD93_12905 [Deltaproteobacteria bacterium]|nr:hypothetical protein [Deltaproteobacteria bacterium]
MTTDECKDKHCSYNDIKRTNYFHGMLMTERDFREEQIYHIEKRKLLNRMLHGWGVVCGLKVKPTVPPSPNIIIEGGLALDCFGNEILVCEEQTVDLTVKPCATTAAYEALYVVIKYDERGTKPEPVYAPGGSCEEKTCNFSRIQEGFCIEVWDHPPDAPETGDTTEPFTPCTKPFPCPPSDCCHYILLATISCKERFDFLSKWVEWDFVEQSTKKSIYYQIKRTLDKDSEDVIQVTDIYEFETDEIVNNIKWVINADTYENQTKSITVLHTINENIDKFEVKVGLEYQDSVGNIIIWNGSKLPTLQSEIDTVNTIVKRGNIISAPMIRNMELRKYVPTFNWLAWIMGSHGENSIPWSGYLKKFCASEVHHAIYKAQLDELIKRVEELEKNQSGT